MARWRDAVELVMTEEEVAKLVAISRSRTEPAQPGRASADAARLS